MGGSSASLAPSAFPSSGQRAARRGEVRARATVKVAVGRHGSENDRQLPGSLLNLAR